MEDTKYIRIRGAYEHNLKNIDIDIPKNKLVVLTGISGSGKFSLAFDTIYADGQRRYMESMSSYARQFLGQMKRPDVLSIEGLSPAISISQKSTNRNPRSTVGTVTEIYDYLRLLYARIGIPHCPKCGREVKKQSVNQIIDQIMALPESSKIRILAPVVRGRKGRHEKVLEQAKKNGYVRVNIDGIQYDLSEEISLDKEVKHNIEIVVDRLVVRPGIEDRLSDSIETSFKHTDGICRVDGICEKTYSGITKNYYVLHPIESNCNLTINTPVDNDKVTMLELLNREKAEEILESFTLPGVEWIELHSDRNQIYSEILKTGDRKEIAKVANTLLRRKYNIENGKKFHEKDNKLLTTIQSILFTELALVLNTDFETINDRITRLISGNEYQCS